MELLNASFALINFPFTLLLLLVLLYWVLVILGAMDISVLDVSLEAEAPDADAPEGAAEGGGALRALLNYLFIGEVPAMIVLSILVISLWTFAVLANHYVNPARRLWLAAALLVPNLLVSAHVARFVAAPLRRLFRVLERDTQASVSLVGRRCTILTTRADEEFGQAEIRTDGAPLRVMVRTRDGETLPQGVEAVILESSPDQSFYIVTRLDLDGTTQHGKQHTEEKGS